MAKIRNIDEAEKQFYTALGMVHFCRGSNRDPKKFLRQMKEAVEYFEKSDLEIAFWYRQEYENKLKE